MTALHYIELVGAILVIAPTPTLIIEFSVRKEEPLLGYCKRTHGIPGRQHDRVGFQGA